MNEVDWLTILTEAQRSRARVLYQENQDSPRLRDLLVAEVFIEMEAPPGVRHMEAGFLKEYGGYNTSSIGRLLLDALRFGTFTP